MAIAIAYSASHSTRERCQFSTLDLRDHVVIMALFDQLVTESEVEALWYLWRIRNLAFFQEPFWRLLLLLPNANVELLYEQAARVADIETVYISRHAAFTAIRDLKHKLSRASWKELTEFPVVPVAEQGYGRNATGMIFATHDTTNPRVRKLIDSVWTEPYELRYAPRQDLLELLEEERNDRLTSAELSPG